MKRKTHRQIFIVAAALCFALLLLFSAGKLASAEAGDFDLAVAVSVPDHVAPGAVYIAKVVYGNLGEISSPAETQIIFTLPAGVEFISAVDRSGAPLPPDTIDSNLLTWDVGALPANDCNQFILLTLKVADNLPEETELPVQVEIVPTLNDADLTNNVAGDASLVCDMAGSTKQVSGETVRPGDILTYTIQLRLAQREGAMFQQRNVVLTDTLPVGYQVRFLGWSGPVTGEWDGNTLRWQGQVRAGEPLTLQYQVGVEGYVTPGALITNTAHLGWGGKHLQLGPVTTTVELPGNAAMIGRQGSFWQPDPNLSVTVPPDAVRETTRFEFQWMSSGEPTEAPPGYIFAQRAFTLTAFQFGELHQFNKPLTLTLKLDPQEIANLKRETLRLWYRAGPGEPWAMLNAPDWVAEDTLAFTTNHFTEFALFARGDFQIFLPIINR
jgi:uncharacterized repeat protein (TIGR01451 family)